MVAHNYHVTSPEEADTLIGQLVALNKGAKIVLVPDEPIGAGMPSLRAGDHEPYGDTYRRARSCGNTDSVCVRCEV